MSAPPAVWPPAPDGHRYLLVHRSPPAHLASTRLFAASVARGSGSGEEQVADLKLAVSEACTNAIQAGISSQVGVEIEEDGERLVVRVGVVDREAPDAMGFEVIEALFGSLTFRPGPAAGWVVEFSFEPSPG